MKLTDIAISTFQKQDKFEDIVLFFCCLKRARQGTKQVLSKLSGFIKKMF